MKLINKFNRFKENLLFDMQDEFAFPYLDDILVFLDTFDHLIHLKNCFKECRREESKSKLVNVCLSNSK